jgi:hypothetical protein
MKSEKISFAAIAVAVGGLFGALATFATWWTYQALLLGGSGAGVDVSVKGISDWTGKVAAVAGFSALVFAAAYILMSDSSLQRVFGVLMAVASVLLVGVAMIGALRMNSIVQAQAAPVAVNAASRGAGLIVAVLAGIVAFAGSLLVGMSTSTEVVAESDTVVLEQVEAK